MVKNFRRISNARNLRPRSTASVKFFRTMIESSAASAAAPLGPSLGQLQIPLIEFCDSFNEASSALYNESIDLGVQLRKYESRYTYSIKFPSANFFLKQAYLFYEFDLENYIYDYYVVLVQDLWFIVRSFSAVNGLDGFKSTQCIFGYLYSSAVRQIICLVH